MFMSFLKKVVRRFLPKKSKGNLVGPTFFRSYEEALSKCGDSKGYQEEALVEVVVEKNRLYMENVARDSTLDLEDLRVIIGVAATGHSGSLRVIDFGGGGGSPFYKYQLCFGACFEFALERSRDASHGKRFSLTGKRGA